MGRYIDWSDIAGRYPDIARQGGAESVASYWLAYAEAEVDARLAAKYTTPFSPAPTLVRDLCIDLTYYRMTIRQKGSELIRESLDERFAGIINGTISLPNTVEIVADTLAWSEQAQPGYHTAFGPDDALNWRPSSAYMLDVSYERGQW